jgi:hypothetical protein
MLAVLESATAFRVILFHKMLGEVASKQPAHFVRQRQQDGERFVSGSRRVSPGVKFSHLIGSRMSQFLQPICQQQDSIFFTIEDREAMANNDRVNCL